MFESAMNLGPGCIHFSRYIQLEIHRTISLQKNFYRHWAQIKAKTSHIIQSNWFNQNRLLWHELHFYIVYGIIETIGVCLAKNTRGDE